LLTKLQWKVSGRQQINPNAQQFLKLDLQPAKIEQRRSRQGIDQQVKITPFMIRPK